MNVNVVIGDILDYSKIEADAIFIPAKEDLMPTKGISSRIHAIAGDELKKECKKFEKCQVGCLRVTKSFDFKRAKFIVHCSIPHKKIENSEEIFKSLFEKIASTIRTFDFKTVLFPALGCESFGWTPKESADICIGQFSHYSQMEKQFKLPVERLIFVLKNRNEFTPFVLNKLRII